MSSGTRVADFDSASGMVEALAAYLDGRELPAGGLLPRPAAAALWPLARRLSSRAPDRFLEWGYGRAGWMEGIEADEAGEVSAERIARRFAEAYPDRGYRAVLVGSANGAAVHLAALLGAPWLPQNFLVLVRHGGMDVDDPASIAAWGTGPGSAIADANPEVLVHQMHDPNQDRLMSRHVGYFRGKRLTLGTTYERFLDRSLAPGGALVVIECRKRWPGTRMTDRLRFQVGGLGGLTPEEYLNGSARVARHLEARGSPHRDWSTPDPDGEYPEAEWGLEEEFLEDARRVAKDRGYRLLRLVFEEPEALSPLVADLHRHRLRGRGIAGGRLVADCFSLISPYWAATTGAVPFWLAFNAEPSADRLDAYLDRTDPFDEIHLLLLQHGTESIGLASGERWQKVADRAKRWGRLVAVAPEQHPRHFSVFLGFQEELRSIPARYPLPSPPALGDVEAFLRDRGERYGVELVEEGVTGPTRAESGSRATPPATDESW